MSEIDGHVLRPYSELHWFKIRYQWLALIHPNILLKVKIKENILTMYFMFGFIIKDIEKKNQES